MRVLLCCDPVAPWCTALEWSGTCWDACPLVLYTPAVLYSNCAGIAGGSRIVAGLVELQFRVCFTSFPSVLVMVEVAHDWAVSWVVAFGSDCDISWSCH